MVELEVIHVSRGQVGDAVIISRDGHIDTTKYCRYQGKSNV